MIQNKKEIRKKGDGEKIRKYEVEKKREKH